MWILFFFGQCSMWILTGYIRWGGTPINSSLFKTSNSSCKWRFFGLLQPQHDSLVNQCLYNIDLNSYIEKKRDSKIDNDEEYSPLA